MDAIYYQQNDPARKVTQSILIAERCIYEAELDQTSAKLRVDARKLELGEWGWLLSQLSNMLPSSYTEMNRILVELSRSFGFAVTHISNKESTLSQEVLLDIHRRFSGQIPQGSNPRRF